MSTVLLDLLGEALVDAARKNGWDPPGGADRVPIEVPRDPSHGDFATNLALVLSKQVKKSPREVAEKLIASLPVGEDLIAAVDVAGPGFINFRLAPRALHDVLLEILHTGPRYGSSDGGKGVVAQVEYVSANPTGPMNVVNARAAAIGDALVRLLAATGYDAKSEFYVNDAGRQIELLGQSFQARYRERLGRPGAFPEEGYQGEYVKDLVVDFPATEAEAALADPKAARFASWALERMLRWQREDLEHYGMHFDHWARETALHEGGKLELALAELESRGHVYEQEGAKWFRSTAFGDEKDRVLVRQNGEPTYFLADIAYHRDKFDRGFRKVIDLWGPDHHGHVHRLQSGLAAIGLPEGFLEVVIVQFVKLLSGGEPVKMSKRAGEFVTLRELVDEVGADNAKYFFLMRSATTPLDFDLDLAKKQSDENPAYYVQYAHARISSLVRYAEGHGIEAPARPGERVGLLDAPEELALLKELAMFPDVVRGAARAREPHRIPTYLARTAESFHRFYHVHRVVTDDRARSEARLLLCLAARQVVRNGLDLLGVSAPERM